MIDNKVKELSDYISYHSVREAACFPVDRYFLEPYVKQILELNTRSFLLYNFEKIDTLYPPLLMLCLPDLWSKVTVDDIFFLIENFTNPFFFYSLILFTYKYLEIDILPWIFELEIVPAGIRDEIKKFLSNQYPNLIRWDEDMFWDNEDILGIKISDWEYLKQKFLLDERAKEAKRSIEELGEYIDSIS